MSFPNQKIRKLDENSPDTKTMVYQICNPDNEIKSMGVYFPTTVSPRKHYDDQLSCDIISNKGKYGPHTARLATGMFFFMKFLYPKFLLSDYIVPIPAQLADTNSIAWGESRMNELENQLYTGSMGAISGDGGIDKVKDAFKGTLETLGANPNMVSSFFAQKAVNSLIGGNITLDQLMARSQGEILNPNLELLFSGPTLRNFTFNFKLTPRYEKEAQIIRTIIKSFKRNMAPKGSGGTVLRTPNIFQIEYMGRAKDYLNRMKLCALKNVAVNYTGDGTFATYKDGAPISSMLTLSFTELTPIYSEDYAGYDNNEDGVGY